MFNVFQIGLLSKILETPTNNLPFIYLIITRIPED